MFHPKVADVFRALESWSQDIQRELDSFMSGISDWADGLLETIEKEHGAGAEYVFRLPKTPSVRYTRNRKPKNTGVNMVLPVETSDMDKTITSRGRTTRRGTKMNITRDVNLTETMQNIEEDKIVEKTIVPQANTRTVLRSKQPEVAVLGGSSKRESPPEKVETSEHASRKTRSCCPEESLIGVTETRVSGRRKMSRTLSSSPLTSKKICRNLSSGPARRSSSVIIHRTLSKSPVRRSRSYRNASRSPETQNCRNKSMNNLTNQTDKHNTPGLHSNMGNKVVKKELTPLAASTFILDDTLSAKEITPVVKEERNSRFNSTSTHSIAIEKTYLVNAGNENESVYNVAGGTPDLFASSNADNFTEESTQDAERPKKKRKLKKNEMKENIEMSDTMRITRTKSKAIKETMENAAKESDLPAKKLVNKAKMTKLRKSQLDSLLLKGDLPRGNASSSESKYHMLVASSKEMKTPLGPLPNGMRKVTKMTADKDQSRPKVAGRDNSTESTTRSATKPLNPDLLEKETKLKSKLGKEKTAELKRQNKQAELKRKNELKHEMAMKQREKLKQEKFDMIQSEKEREGKHKLLLEERRLKLKEDAFKRKMLTEQKIAETGERRRLEEEARIAKLKEMEGEKQRLALEKQKRLEPGKVLSKKCLESGSKVQSASKRPKLEITVEKREWDYKPRNEDDYGLEDENSEVDSEDENSYENVKPPKDWAKKILLKKCHVVKHVPLEMLKGFMICHRKSPDVNKMFQITPS